MYLLSTPHHKREVSYPFQSLIDLISGECCAGTNTIGGYVGHAHNLSVKVKKKAVPLPKIVYQLSST